MQRLTASELEDLALKIRREHQLRPPLFCHCGKLAVSGTYCDEHRPKNRIPRIPDGYDADLGPDRDDLSPSRGILTALGLTVTIVLFGICGWLLVRLIMQLGD